MTNELDLIVSKIIRQPGLHSRWLNTLSFLEYIGFRKIVKSQLACQLDFETLGHAVEEGRHALRLKKLAVRVGGSQVETYSEEAMLCGASAENYFQSLDRTCFNLLTGPDASENQTRLTYLYVTWLVEMRALQVYELYQRQLFAQGQALSLEGLLAEEKEHLAAVESELRASDPNFDGRARELKILEEALFQGFIRVLSLELNSFESPVEAYV